MIDPTQQATAYTASAASDRQQKVLHWRKNERMGGMVPVWEPGSTAQNNVERTLTAAGSRQSFDSALSYADARQDTGAGQPQEFGFGDLIDIINPLQHIPIVSQIYREVTGDQIRPIAKIVGGAAFGGFAGAASGIVDTVVEYETGRSLAGNVVAMVTSGEAPTYRSTSDTPQERLNEAATIAQNTKTRELPGTALAFADLGNNSESYQPVQVADGRTAGTMWKRQPPGKTVPASAMPREPITELHLSPMPSASRGYNS